MLEAYLTSQDPEMFRVELEKQKAADIKSQGKEDLILSNESGNYNTWLYELRLNQQHVLF